jgi:hypothetical protein
MGGPFETAVLQSQENRKPGKPWNAELAQVLNLDLSRYCSATPAPEIKPPHPMDKDWLRHTFEDELRVRPNLHVSREDGLAAIDGLRKQDLEALDHYADAIRRNPPDWRRIQSILNQYNCDPERLEKLKIAIDLLSNDWGVAVTKPDENGNATINIYKYCLDPNGNWLAITPFQPEISFKTDKCLTKLVGPRRSAQLEPKHELPNLALY